MDALHSAFLKQMQEILPEDNSSFIEAINGEVPISVRINPYKKSQLDLPFDQPIPWTSKGHYLKKRPIFTLDPSLRENIYFFQFNNFFKKEFRTFLKGISIVRNIEIIFR